MKFKLYANTALIQEYFVSFELWFINSELKLEYTIISFKHSN